MKEKEKCVIQHLFKQNSHMGSIDVSGNKFSNGCVSNVAYSKMPFDDGEDINLFFTTGLLSNIVYVTISDGDISEITNLLSNFEFGDKYGVGSKLGSVIQLQDNEYLKRNRCCGVVMLRVNTVFFLESFESKIEFGGDEIEFLLVVFLDEREYNFVKEEGLKKFLESLGDKDIFSITQ